MYTFGYHMGINIQSMHAQDILWCLDAVVFITEALKLIPHTPGELLLAYGRSELGIFCENTYYGTSARACLI